MDPKNHENRADGAAAAAASGDVAGAVEILLAMLRESPRSPSIHYDLGVLYAALGNRAVAERYLSEAIPLAEQDMLTEASSAATTVLAKVLVAAGRQNDAAGLFARHAARADAAYNQLMSFGQLFTQLGQRENALAAYHAAADLNPVALCENVVPAGAWVATCPFTADRPSPRYAELIAQYELMHRVGRADNRSQGATTFEGFVGFAIMAPYIRRFAGELEVASMLDYGGGRGEQYRLGAIVAGGQSFADPAAYLGLKRVACFDPGISQDLPAGEFDLVICIDALEHCDRQDLPWIVRRLFAKARHGVFANIASYAAGKTLPNGENAHCTIEEAPWWMALFSAVAGEFPAVSYQVIVAKDLRQNTRTIFGRAASV